eukprot:1138834-Pelagomonas_calceolata.AAC.1
MYVICVAGRDQQAEQSNHPAVGEKTMRKEEIFPKPELHVCATRATAAHELKCTSMLLATRYSECHTTGNSTRKTTSLLLQHLDFVKNGSLIGGMGECMGVLKGHPYPVPCLGEITEGTFTEEIQARQCN